MVKFGRNYSLRVELNSGDILTIAPPFTLEFDISRKLYSSANFSSLRIYNLSQNNRNQIRKDVTDYGNFRSVELAAGYGKVLPIVFKGNITQAWSVREGTNFITQIESFDGGFAYSNGFTDGAAGQFAAATPLKAVITSLADSLPGVSLGAIGDYSYITQPARGPSYSGPTCSLLSELTGGGFFIDNSKVNCLGDSECLGGNIQVINAKSGLLGTPVREQTILHFDMLFEPQLLIGQKIQLQSVTDANFNGYYKITALHHRGIISESVCGSAVTTASMFYGTQALSTVASE